MKNKQKFKCSKCDKSYLKWQGICPECKTWNSIVQEENTNNFFKNKQESLYTYKKVKHTTGFLQFDKSFQGGLPDKSLVLLGGEPGVGKSSYLTQIAHKLSGTLKTIYFSGEESRSQVIERVERLTKNECSFLIENKRNFNEIKDTIIREKAKFIIIDSIQTLEGDDLFQKDLSTGGIKSLFNQLVEFVNKHNLICFCICHITKDGKFSGPKLIEHMADVSLLMEHYKDSVLLNIKKNRFGTIESSISLKMTECGLKETNTSKLSLESKDLNDGVSYVLDNKNDKFFIREVQSLIIDTRKQKTETYVTGFNKSRIIMLLAIIEKRLRIALCNCEVFCHLIGEDKSFSSILELGVIASILSSYYEVALPSNWLFIGEVDLSSEVRLNTGVIKSLDKQNFSKGTVLITSFEYKRSDVKIININNCLDLKELILGLSNEQKAS